MKEIYKMAYLEEYKILREEMMYHIKSRDQITFVFLTATFGILGYDFMKQLTDERLFYIPISIW